MELLTTKELTDKLKVSRQSINNWMDNGMPYFLKNPHRFIWEDVIEWIKKREQSK
ncbi:MAG: helix-turn-helix domain-containing protein [Candidatus Cloacimonadota bacterium]|nr:helix-turn-helix domain-containing protein [Candidatus Cloacimonadota bacterium]